MDKKITFRIPDDLFWQFKRQLAEDRTTATEKLLEMISNYVKEPR